MPKFTKSSPVGVGMAFALTLRIRTLLEDFNSLERELDNLDKACMDVDSFKKGVQA